MEKNIFEGAKFGDKFVTRDGRVAIYQCSNLGVWHHLFTDKIDMFVYNSGEQKDGLAEQDIVSRYQESIDEGKLDELAKAEANQAYISVEIKNGIEYGFKAGYRKAMEE